MIPIRRRLYQSLAGFTPRQLFAALQGAWLEPVVGNIWQENTGVTPTTTGGQTIGLMLDQSQGAVLGPELVTNGDFSNGTTGWAVFVGSQSVTAGRLRVTPTGSITGRIYQAFSATVGKTYQVSYEKYKSTDIGCNVSILTDYQNITTIIGGSTISTQDGAGSAVFIATAATLYVMCRTSGTSASVYAEFDNISIREIAGNHAAQSTAANRPVLGRRYNLLTYSEDISNAAWGIDGTASKSDYRTLLTPAANDGIRQLVLTSAYNNAYTFSCVLSGSGTITVALRVSGGSTGWVQQNDVTLSATPTRFTASGTVTDAASNGVIGYIRRLNNTTATSVTVTQCDLRLTSDVGKDPAYQRITTATDYDFGQYPAAVHDTTDSLVVSLPAINVRRNLLTWSEQFDNSVWIKANASVTENDALAPDGTATADKVIVNTGVSTGNTYQTPTLSANTFYTYSVYAKKSEWNWVALEFRGELSDVRVAWFNLNSGVVGTVQSGLTATITPASNGYYRCSVTGDTKLTAASTRTRVYPTNSDNAHTTGDGTSGIYIWGAQLELGSTATDHQKITDWTSEAYASSGSAYFATPQGMSALHGKSMGLTYTLPALSTDIYSWIVVPQRLNTALEGRLERYMLRKAGLVVPDYLTDDAGEILTDDIGDPLLAG